MILTTLSDYAKQKGISRARAYQLQSKLPTIDLPVYAVKDIPGGGNVMYPLVKDGNHLKQTYVQQSMSDVIQERSMLRMNLNLTDDTATIKRIKGRLEAIESILK